MKELDFLLRRNPELGVITNGTVRSAADVLQQSIPKEYGRRTRPFALTLHNERPMSWNVLYAGAHWSKRKELVDRTHSIVRNELQAARVPRELFAGPVAVQTTVYFDKNPLDSCNIADKLYIDAFIGWLFADDSLDYIRRTERTALLDPYHPRMEFRIALVGNEAVTGREREVLALLAQGHSRGEIGRILGMARRTVDTHLTAVYNKLGASNAAHAIALGLTTGVLDHAQITAGAKPAIERT